MTVLKKKSCKSSSCSSYLSHCDICPMAKKVRLPFQHSNIRAIACFDLVHINVWGPYKVPTYNGITFSL